MLRCGVFLAMSTLKWSVRPQVRVFLFSCYFTTGRGAKYCNEYIYLSVCWHISETTSPTSPFLCMLLVAVAWSFSDRVSLHTADFVDNIIFSLKWLSHSWCIPTRENVPAKATVLFSFQPSFAQWQRSTSTHWLFTVALYITVVGWKRWTDSCKTESRRSRHSTLMPGSLRRGCRGPRSPSPTMKRWPSMTSAPTKTSRANHSELLTYVCEFQKRFCNL